MCSRAVGATVFDATAAEPFAFVFAFVFGVVLGVAFSFVFAFSFVPLGAASVVGATGGAVNAAAMRVVFGFAGAERAARGGCGAADRCAMAWVLFGVAESLALIAVNRPPPTRATLATATILPKALRGLATASSSVLRGVTADGRFGGATYCRFGGGRVANRTPSCGGRGAAETPRRGERGAYREGLERSSFGSVMSATRRKLPEHRGQQKTSSENVLIISSAQGR